jgi:hypothetical protein
MRLPVLLALTVTLGVGDATQRPGYDDKPFLRAKPSSGLASHYEMPADYESSDQGKARGYVDWSHGSGSGSSSVTGSGSSAEAATVHQALWPERAPSSLGESLSPLKVLGAMTGVSLASYTLGTRGDSGGSGWAGASSMRLATGGWSPALMNYGAGVSKAASGGFGPVDEGGPAPVSPIPAALQDDPPALQPTLASATHVPEPSTWLTMIIGFGGIGALLRRRAGRLAIA